MLRFLVLAFAIVWLVASVGRFSRRLGRGPSQPIRGALPAAEPPPRSDRLIGVFRTVIGLALFVAFAGTLIVVTDLGELAVVLIAAPVAGVISGLLTERFVSEGDG